MQTFLWLGGCLLIAEPPSSVNGTKHPFDVPDDAVFTQVAVGGGSVCGLTDEGWVFCEFFDRGPDDIFHEPEGTIVALAGGGLYGDYCAVNARGKLTCWGWSFDDPDMSPPSGSSWSTVSVGGGSGCALDTDGFATCFGNTSGPAPRTSTLQGLQFSQIDVGEYGSTCGILINGEPICFGWLDGDAPVDQAITHVQVGTDACGVIPREGLTCWGFTAPEQTLTGNIVALEAGDSHFCAVMGGGDIRCIGDAEHGEANDQDGDFVDVSASHDQTCALTRSGRIRCWGDVNGNRFPFE
ncbi:MAG: hypothetical protein H6739_30065 [Alphaproteobacteria bacterium]|nr:hypothetical protein [Alphaproteobacteria bacterium]